ncbi:S-adenosylmethionine synthetase [Pseudomonas fluorescens]|uniref:methionine adenosyltransferase n=1 Tax=Pseudomonas TaxID=286 RepID=UPI000812573D|nr:MULTISPECIES: methionine adenosyltransferase [Pseudomonas]MBD8099214.1 S-adenosylmethionine synthetase [Pseudomonas fluorescens]MBD8774133.1 S-adenosylmethionine synthetase [Pseudomonas fluorescens]MBD8780837.1 S-adenosylmethionine synthetase [Pseudomonas fluorescens]MBD8796714.1 S-adenosylmethionine synthetase [Pseudomonas fluorescens]CRM79588.1 S-adenosylmethionine synthetase [Pseudomonas sp. 37 R 15]
MSNVSIVTDSHSQVDGPATETVERKGYGHPDTLCDQISELTSVLYSQFCMKHFGRVAHHWFDKVMLIGGEAEIGFNEGRLLTPYEVILAGKAATWVGEVEIPVTALFKQAAISVLTTTLRNFSPDKDLVVTNRVRSGRGPGQAPSRYRPADANDLNGVSDAELVSNDCNVCSAYFPLSTLEEMVLNVDEYLLHGEGAQHFDYLGSDIKTVGWRKGTLFSLVVNVPFIADCVASYADYMEKCEALEEHLSAWLLSRWAQRTELVINPERRWKRAYLTVTGTVADTGDVGVTGRGNRMNGLITPGREMSIEAVAGKNPLDHTGKLYNALAGNIARSVYEAGGYPCRVGISTVKGAPLKSPVDVNVVISAPTHALNALEPQVKTIIDAHLSRVHEISTDFIRGDVIRVC